MLSGDEKDTLLHSDDLSSLSPGAPRTYKLYRARWVILSVLLLLNLSNGILWISFASITDKVKDFYSLSSDLPVNLLSLVFFVVSLPVGFVGAWVLDTWGLRIGLLIGAWLNGIGAVVRYCSTFGRHYSVVMVGQVICATAQPFVLFAPTKLASLWFGEKERATANMIASMANPIGVAIASVSSPAFGTVEEMLWVYAIPAGVGAILTTVVFSIWGARPPTPPSASADEKSSFWNGLKNFWKFKSYVFLLISWGFGVGMFNAIQTFIEQLLCTRGYSDDFAGLCGALLIFFGIPGALIAGLIVDHTRRYKEVMKVSFVLAAACSFWFTVVIRYENEELLIGAAISTFGFFALAMLPVCLELSVECTYPHMSEATSAGLLWMIGQVMGIVLVFVGQIPGLVTQLDPMDAPNSTCDKDSHSHPNTTSSRSPSVTLVTSTPHSGSHDTVPDMINFSWAMSAMAMAVAVSTVVMFWPRYRRIEHEKEASKGNGTSTESPVN